MNAQIVLGAVVVGLVVATTVSAMILRASVWMFNRFAGGPRSPASVPEPSFERAIVITVVAGIVYAYILVIIAVIISLTASAPLKREMEGAGPLYFSLHCGNMMASFLVTSTMLTLMLPTTFSKAVVVSSLQIVFVSAILLMIGIFYVLITIVVSGPSAWL